MSATPQLATVRLSSIVFDEVIYPRREHDPALVQRYAETLDEIEAAGRYLSVGADMKLLDGKHRWLAYRTRYGAEDREIQVLVYPVTAPHDQLRLAAKLNSDHGWQLTDDDKETTAKSLYAYGMSYEEIASALSVGKTRVSAWLARTVKDNKEKRNRKIVDLWLACYSQEEIAEACNVTKETVSEVVNIRQKQYQDTESDKATASHLIDFDPPIYNIWKQQERSAGASHFGNSEVRWLDNLLYLYTQPFDIVIDPFAGSGSTVTVCKKRLRRYYVSDRLPIAANEDNIRKHDLVTDGLPKPPQWKDVRLVYLDPPYWKQAEGRYSTDPSDLANMPLDQFTSTLAGIITGFAKKLPSGACIALIIQPTQWKAPEHAYTDHVADMLRAVTLPVDMRYSVPYESQQCTAQMVEWAKAHKRTLVLTRELVVWRVP